jgi:DNA-binding CsgD family transcriptional regulator
MPLRKSEPHRESALSRTLAGQALARAGQSDRAVSELQRATATFDACGALRYRDGAERELGKLGQRPHRRTRAGSTEEAGIDSLTERELQVVRLVVDRNTNREIAAELFLSQKTVETHLRNIFRKMDVSSRVDRASSSTYDGARAVRPRRARPWTHRPGSAVRKIGAGSGDARCRNGQKTARWADQTMRSVSADTEGGRDHVRG